MSIEHRIKLFYELHKNKWFHVMNFVITEMLIEDKKERFMHSKYAFVFYKLYN